MIQTYEEQNNMKQELEKRKYAYEMVIEELINFGELLNHETSEYKILLQTTYAYNARLEEVYELITFLQPESIGVGRTY